jgi:two-component system nitrogen regulation sensor histidine kinase NtrY
MTTLGLVILGPVLAILTYVVFGPLDQGAASPALRIVLLADLVYVLVIAALVANRIARIIAARRAKSAGSRLHLRLTGVFALLALIPTVLVAIFAALVINIGLEGWFSERVRNVVGSSLSAATAYQQQLQEDLSADGNAMARGLNRELLRRGRMNDGELRQNLASVQQQVQRGVQEAFIIDGTGAIRARGDRSYLFDFDQPTTDQIAEANENLVVIEDWENNEFRALVRMTSFPDHYLYISREVDGDLLRLLDETQETVIFYQQLESERGRRLFEFGLIYLGFALILILAAIWFGLSFAERLSGPVGRLAGAAQRVGGGDLDVRVPEEEGDDEISMLGRYFNQMTRQLKGQREALLDNTRQIERRRRLFDSVLSSVTSGVVGLDPTGNVTFVNRSAERLLLLEEGDHHPLAMAVPEFGVLFQDLQDGNREVLQREIRLTRAGHQENLLVRMATRRGEEQKLEGYVVAFDDVTDLVSAQRMAAWGDVARRIAHEIKNPLTPIQLSAERLKRKFSPVVGEASDDLEQMTDVIVRQTNDLRRIVDEFAKFARMPEPELHQHDLVKLVRDAVLLQDSGLEEVEVTHDLPDTEFIVDVDATMISQALTNLIKNGGEAIESAAEKGLDAETPPRVHVTLDSTEDAYRIRIIDTGIGLPDDRSRLFEPYVTTRDKGTGLGLPIVKKIIEEHGGTLALLDAPNHRGAMADIRLPRDANSEQLTDKT